MVDMLHDVLAPLDGPWATLSRCHILIHPDVFRTYIKEIVEKDGCIIFWYDTNLIEDNPMDLKLYTQALQSTYGCEGVHTVASKGQPHGIFATLYTLRENYVRQVLGELRSFDVVMFCVAPENTAMLQSGRRTINDEGDLVKNTQLVGQFSSERERDKWVDACVLSSLSLAVVRFVAPFGTDDLHPTHSKDSAYRWEPERRVPCYYL